METITTYLNGSFTGYEVLAMALVGGWLLFNAGFFAGAAWKGMFSEQADAIERRHAPRCQPRLKV